jgi:hypothetical protein
MLCVQSSAAAFVHGDQSHTIMGKGFAHALDHFARRSGALTQYRKENNTSKPMKAFQVGSKVFCTCHCPVLTGDVYVTATLPRLHTHCKSSEVLCTSSHQPSAWPATFCTAWPCNADPGIGPCPGPWNSRRGRGADAGRSARQRACDGSCTRAGSGGRLRVTLSSAPSASPSTLTNVDCLCCNCGPAACRSIGSEQHLVDSSPCEW